MGGVLGLGHGIGAGREGVLLGIGVDVRHGGHRRGRRVCCRRARPLVAVSCAGLQTARHIGGRGRGVGVVRAGRGLLEVDVGRCSGCRVRIGGVVV